MYEPYATFDYVHGCTWPAFRQVLVVWYFLIFSLAISGSSRYGLRLIGVFVTLLANLLFFNRAI